MQGRNVGCIVLALALSTSCGEREPPSSRDEAAPRAAGAGSTRTPADTVAAGAGSVGVGAAGANAAGVAGAASAHSAGAAGTGGADTASADTSGAGGVGADGADTAGAAGTAAAGTAGADTPGAAAVALVSASGLTLHRTTTAPAEVLALAREDRPESIRPAFVASAGEVAGARVFWFGYLTSGIAVARARAEAEGRLEAFDDDLERRLEACEAESDVGDCEYCLSDCWDRIPSSIAPTRQELRIVRVSWPAGGAPRLDASTPVWTGQPYDVPSAQLRRLEDLDGDGRPELVVGIETSGTWPAGDGGDRARLTVYVDGDSLAVQLRLPQSYEEDGHTGAVTERVAVSFRDRNGDGVGDFGLHFQRTVEKGDCTAAAEVGELPEECRARDQRVVAMYSREHRGELVGRLAELLRERDGAVDLVVAELRVLLAVVTSRLTRAGDAVVALSAVARVLAGRDADAVAAARGEAGRALAAAGVRDRVAAERHARAARPTAEAFTEAEVA